MTMIAAASAASAVATATKATACCWGCTPGRSYARRPWRHTTVATIASAALTPSRPGASRWAATLSTTPASVTKPNALRCHARPVRSRGTPGGSVEGIDHQRDRHDHPDHGDPRGEQPRRPGWQRLVEAQRALVLLPAPVAHE